ncbi:polysaccharide deacetylase family protein [Paenibacillus turpanensis]|uniref:polysaccharide deacetylase family protein n=1 Tax=Paenibacillus turpanensis TaxID=2689078 RepID=UPI001FB74AE5|nr:polysaccharide deacetylase family protein [Paenibacillus turpanensis]
MNKSRIALITFGCIIVCICLSLVGLAYMPDKAALTNEVPDVYAQPIPPDSENQSSADEPNADMSNDPEDMNVTPQKESTNAPPSQALPIQPAVIPPAPPASVVTEKVYLPDPKQPISIPVLNYHSVSVEPGNSAVVTPEQFAEQMEYLFNEGYTPLKLADFIEIYEFKKAPPQKPVLLTFDDGYVDNLTAADPVLKKYQFPATVFVSPGVAGTKNFMNWEQIRELHKAGWDIQAHGMTHPQLPKLSKDKQEHEIKESKRLIEEELGTKVEVFCYPYGQYNKTTLSLLKENGYRYAFTIQQGRTTTEQPALELKRIFVNGEESLQTFAKRLESSK